MAKVHANLTITIDIPNPFSKYTEEQVIHALEQYGIPHERIVSVLEVEPAEPLGDIDVWVVNLDISEGLTLTKSIANIYKTSNGRVSKWDTISVFEESYLVPSDLGTYKRKLLADELAENSGYSKWDVVDTVTVEDERWNIEYLQLDPTDEYPHSLMLYKVCPTV